MDGMFTEIFKPVLRNIHKCHIEEVKHHTQKEQRIIDTIEPVLNQHRLIIHPDVIEKDLQVTKDNHNRVHSLFFQLTRITRERGALRHDDVLDALSIGVNYWVEHMALDNQVAQEQHDEKLLDEELRIFFENLVDKSAMTMKRSMIER